MWINTDQKKIQPSLKRIILWSDMQTLKPEYKRTVEYVNGYNSDIQKVLERNFIAARRSVEKNDFYKQFKGRNLKETCENVWNYLKDNVQYLEDGPVEQKIKMPPRLLADGKGDCKSYSLFACAVLSHYAPVAFRYTSYREDPTPTHVYCIVDGGKYIVDAVWHSFNEQKPYTYKYDKRMKISTLSGIKPKVSIDPETYALVSFFDKQRRKYPKGSHERGLMDLYFSAYAKHGIDTAKKAGTVDLTVSSEADKLYNTAVNKANKFLPVVTGDVAIGAAPDWATGGDKTAHALLIANPAMVASRAAFLALSELNAFGIIDRLFEKEKEKPLSISRWWYRSGGDPDKLWKHLTSNRKNKPFFGVSATVKKLIDKVKSAAGIRGTEEEIGQVVTAAATATGAQAVLATITAALPILTSLLAVTGDIFNKVKEIKAGTVPPTVEPPAPNAGPDDNTKKYLMWGGIGLLAAGGIYLATRKNK